MGILDEAIRDHLELKRRGGTQEQDLMRLEDEAFGPPTRPGDPEPGSEVASEAAQALKAEDEAPPAERATAASAPAPESAPAQESAPAANGMGGTGAPEPEGGSVFHDFAAEEGLVAPSAGAAAVEQEFNVEEAPPAPATESDAVQERAPEPEPPAPPEPEPPARSEPEGSEQAPATPVPQSLDDTQPHDMEAELGSVETEPQREPAAADEADDDLKLHVEEEEEIEIVEEDIEIVEEEDTDDSPEELSADDVLEETPDFLQDTPEHDRLWFEQKPPKDFDFDE